MSGRLDYAKIKAKIRGRHGEHTATRWNTGRWRTEYPEQFPVTTSTKESVSDNLRPIDYNGHVPDDAPDPDEYGDFPGFPGDDEVCAECEAQDAVIEFARAILPVLQDAQAQMKELLERAGIEAA